MRSCKKSFLRGSNATEAIRFFSSLRGSGDSHNEAIQNKNMDCHDFALQNLAMTNLSQIYESLRDSRNDKSVRFVFARRFIAEANQIRSKNEP